MAPLTDPKTTQALLDAVKAEGFEAAGLVDWAPSRELYAEHMRRYDEWIEAGSYAEMGYMPRGTARRRNPETLLPGFKSVLCVLKRYPSAALDFEGLRYARYLSGTEGDGRDYHLSMAEKLERACQKVKATQAELASMEWKVCVDTSAVLERAWAELCGLGWIGKNSTLIHPQLGSYTFIGVVLLNIETGQAPKPMKSRCGHCERCLVTCPTQALSTEFATALDATRCVSCWTLECKPETHVRLRDQVDAPAQPWVAGCDQCQEVCPFNVKPPELNVQEAWLDRLDALEDAYEDDDAEDYAKLVEGSAIERMKYEAFVENMGTALSALENEEEAD